MTAAASTSPALVSIAGAPEGFDALLLADLARRAKARACCMSRATTRGWRGWSRRSASSRPSSRCWRSRPGTACPTTASRRTATSSAGASTRWPAWRASRPKGRGSSLTTVAALLQRVPPRSAFRRRDAHAGAGRSSSDAIGWCSFSRATAMSAPTRCARPGEFAVRGGIVDLFPPASAAAAAARFLRRRARERSAASIPLTQRTHRARSTTFVLLPASARCCSTTTRSSASARAIASCSAPRPATIRSTRRSAPAGAMPAWSIGCRCSTSGWRRCSIICPAPRRHARPSGRRRRSTARLEIDRRFLRRAAQSRARRGRRAAAVYRPLPPERLYLERQRMETRLPWRGRCVRSRRSPRRRRRRPAVDARRAARPRFRRCARPGRRSISSTRRARASRRRAAHAGPAHGRRRRQRRQRATGSIICCASTGSSAHATLRRAGPSIAACSPRTRSRSSCCGSSTASRPRDASPSSPSRTSSATAWRGRRRSGASADQFLAELADFADGDLVVHVEHGIGRYEGLETLDVGGAPHDCLSVLYDGGDKLFVPVENIEVLSRYGSRGRAGAARPAGRRRLAVAQGAGQAAHPRHRRSSSSASPPQRQLHPGRGRGAARGPLRRVLPRASPIAETEDQQRAIDDVLADLASGKPMDRLVCGDVGFGKTEVALRAAFVAAMAGMQVAVVVADDPARAPASTAPSPSVSPACRCASRSSRGWSPPRTPPRSRSELRRRQDRHRHRHPCAAGKSVEFAHLGLVVVDEEQHFGVAHKERLKELHGRCPCADADRDADPAHAAAGAVRRARDEPHRHAAGRPPRGAHLRDAVRSGGDARGAPARAVTAAGRSSTSSAHRRPRRGRRALAQAGARDPVRRWRTARWRRPSSRRR